MSSIHHDRFAARSALVTGAGSATGIGFACARNLGLSGARVAIVSTTDRIEQRAAELRALGIDARGYVCDLTDRAQVAALADALQRDRGRIDLLVNNAGMAQVGEDEPFTPLAAMAHAEWDRSIERNLGTCFNVTRALVGGMVEAGYGRIVNISSVTGPLVSNRGESGYSAAKAAMVGMSRALAMEVARDGVTVNCVAPGWIDSGNSPEHERIAALHTPMGRAGTSAEVADLVAFLASDEATYITGQLFVIDGGNLLQENKGPESGA